MYKEHQQMIEEYARQSVQGTFDVLLFARLSVRRHLFTVPDLIQHVRRRGIEGIPDSMSRKAFKQFHPTAEALVALYPNADAMFRRVLEVPGFGLAKSGFVVQMLTGEFGCLDSHNLTRFGLRDPKFSKAATWVTIERKIEQYKAICSWLGGSEYLWDSWCDYVYHMYPTIYASANQVSWLHPVSVIRGYEQMPAFPAA